ncbi:hypothetical protein HZC09_04560 [Candidatus Micrarchaeota archaeon]|nr:hypothetical protein [Candidatus Micrarchaeota archaeon]
MPIEFARTLVPLLARIREEHPQTVFHLSEIETVFEGVKGRKPLQAGRFNASNLKPPSAVSNFCFTFTIPLDAPVEKQKLLTKRIGSAIKQLESRIYAGRHVETHFEDVEMGQIRTFYFTSSKLGFLKQMREEFKKLTKP